MATSHYCDGKWRSGPVSACPRHTKLAKKQTNVYRGVGEPGGRSGTPSTPVGGDAGGSSSGSAASESSKPSPPKPGSSDG